jgi:hypothetical protein
MIIISKRFDNYFAMIFGARNVVAPEEGNANESFELSKRKKKNVKFNSITKVI